MTNRFQRIAGDALVVLGAFIWTVFATIVVLVMLYQGPRLVYQLRSPSAEKECKQIREGMDLSQVLSIVEKTTDPYDLNYSQNRIFFYREEGGTECSVELDPDSNRVSKVQFHAYEFRNID